MPNKHDIPHPFDGQSVILPTGVIQTHMTQRMCNILWAIRTYHDPMCYPQLNGSDDIFEPELTFAQRLKNYIDFTTDNPDISNETDVIY